MKYFVGLQKVEERSKYFLIEKIIHGVEFQNPYNTPVEKSLKLLKLLKVIIESLEGSISIFGLILLNYLI